jgi:hypothetical protein
VTTRSTSPLVDDELPARLVLLALERRGEARLQVLHELLHVRLQRRPLSGRQAQHLRLIGLVEVEDVAPVRRRLLVRCFLFQQASHERRLVRFRRAEGEYIVSLSGHADAHAQGLSRAVLTEHEVDLVGRPVRQPSGVAGPVQGVRCQTVVCIRFGHLGCV